MKAGVLLRLTLQLADQSISTQHVFRMQNNRSFVMVKQERNGFNSFNTFAFIR